MFFAVYPGGFFRQLPVRVIHFPGSMWRSQLVRFHGCECVLFIEESPDAVFFLVHILANGFAFSIGPVAVHPRGLSIFVVYQDALDFTGFVPGFGGANGLPVFKNGFRKQLVVVVKPLPDALFQSFGIGPVDGIALEYAEILGGRGKPSRDAKQADKYNTGYFHGHKNTKEAITGGFLNLREIVPATGQINVAQPDGYCRLTLSE